MLRGFLVAFISVAILGLAPKSAEAQGPATCWTCYPQQGPDGRCKRIGEGGWDDCKDVSGGGCDARDATTSNCNQVASLVRPDSLELDGGLKLRGLRVHEGVFSVRDCVGKVLDVVYLGPAPAERRAQAVSIVFSDPDDRTPG